MWLGFDPSGQFKITLFRHWLVGYQLGVKLKDNREAQAFAIVNGIGYAVRYRTRSSEKAGSSPVVDDRQDRAWKLAE